MKVIFSKYARQELDDATQYYEIEYQGLGKRFVHTFDCLTQSEARYLLKTENADRIRNKIAEAEQEGNR